MEYTITNGMLTAVISDAGAELHSLKTADGTEYIWQRDASFWRDSAPNLFPYIARLTEGKYVLEGKQYEMKIHGFVKYMVLEAEEVQKDAITFVLRADERTKEQFPYEFTYRMTYRLQGSTLVMTTRVENRDERRMFFGVGGHPGFNVPMEEGLTFEDYVLEFSQPSVPWRVGFNEDLGINGEDRVYPLQDDRRIPLKHGLFDNDAVVLKHADHQVTIRSDKGSRSVTVSYPDFMYVGFWHKPHSEAPYVCVEQWSSLPSRSGITEDLSQQADLQHADPGRTWETTWSITVA